MDVNADKSLNIPEKIARPITFIALVNLILAGDVVISVTGGLADIATWSSLVQWATPIHVVDTIILMGISYLLMEPVLKFLLYQLMAIFPGPFWFFALEKHFDSEAYKEKNTGFIRKTDLKKLAINQNNVVALELWQEAKRDDGKVRNAASHLTVFFFLAFLDVIHGGPFISQIDNLSWYGVSFWGVYVLLLIFYIYASIQNESDYVYLGDLGRDMGNSLRPEPTEPFKNCNDPKVSS